MSNRNSIADHQKYHFIKHHFSPDLLYKFPKNSVGRSFQHQWMRRYPWLRYSKQEDGGYCLPCVLFYRRKNLRAQAGVLVSNVLTNFKNTIDIMKKHEQNDYHKEAVATMDQFVEVMSGQRDCVSIQINNAAKELVVSNRKKLQSIIETIILCGRQNIPLRGRHDAGTDLEPGDCGNHGNFWALLQFRVSAGDATLREHLASAPRNATYTSPDIQNQVIEVLGDHILQKILIKVKQAKYFSLIADEVTDCSNKEQLAVVLRYVDSNDCCIREDLMSFLECHSGISGQVLAEMMLAFLRKHDLDPTKLHGQGYDGASNTCM